MKDLKGLIKSHILTVCAAISLISLLLEFVVVKMSVKTDYATTASTASINGFAAFGQSIFTTILVLGPVLLIAMNYIPQLDKYKSILAVAIPALCILCVFVVFFQVQGATIAAKAAANKAAGAAGASVKMTSSGSLGIGAIIALISYIATAIAGAVTYHGLKLDKESLEKMKTEGASFAKNITNKVSDTAKNITAKKSDNKDEDSDK